MSPTFRAYCVLCSRSQEFHLSKDRRRVRCSACNYEGPSDGRRDPASARAITSLADLIRAERGRAFDAGVHAKTPYRHPEFGTLTADISAHRRAAVEGDADG